jgi:cytochrome c oxidase cbb3-type subunit 3
MTNSISWYIIILTVGNIVGAILLLWWTRRGHGEPEKIGESTTGHTWDGDLREYNNPLPRWWLWLFIVSIVFGVGYLVLYPGLGTYSGTLNWSQVSQYEADRAQLERQLQQTLQRFDGRTIESLVGDPAANQIGRNLFAQNCSTCHGSDARGATGFPNLVDRDWLWGGSTEQIVTTITQGRNGVMPAWGEALGNKAVEDLVAYTLSLSGRTVPAGSVAQGRAQFETVCVACHGADGRGNQALGAPNLTDRIWVYGGSVEAVRQTIALGRQNQMPAQGDKLGTIRINLLAGYILGLGAQGSAGAIADAGT